MLADALMPHQITAANFLAVRGPALLWDDLGLGKTASAIAGADLAGCRKILVCCPAAVRPHWAREFARWQRIPRSIDIIEGHPKSAPKDDTVTIISHAAFANAKATAEIRKSGQYGLFIVDELHNFRTYDAQRVVALLGIGDGAWRCSFRFWGLTGTPVVNSAADLWPTLAGPFYHGQVWWEFVNQFAQFKADGITPTGLRNASSLADILRPHVLRRTLDSVGIVLPSLHVFSTAIPVQRETLAMAMGELKDWTPERLQMAIDANDEVRDEQLSRVRHALGLAKVEQVAIYVWHLMRSGAGPIVVFFQHTEVRKRLYEIFTQWGFQTSWIDGKITPAQLGAAESWFQEGKINILLAQIQAAGQGLTLHRANTCVLAELPWTSVGVQQAVKRIHRIGQTRPCTAHILRASDCWLEDVLASVIGKKQLASENLLSLLTSTQ